MRNNSGPTYRVQARSLVSWFYLLLLLLAAAIIKWFLRTFLKKKKFCGCNGYLAYLFFFFFFLFFSELLVLAAMRIHVLLEAVRKLLLAS